MPGRPVIPPPRLPRALVLLLLAPLLMGKFQGGPSCGCPGAVSRPVGKVMDSIPKPAWTVFASAPTQRPLFSAAAPERRYVVRAVVAQDPAAWTEPQVSLTVSTRPPAVAGSAFPTCCPPSGTRHCAYVDSLQRNAYLAVSIRDGSGAEIPSRRSCRGFAYPCGREPLTTSCSAPGYDIELASASPGAFACDRASRTCTAEVHLTLRATRPSGDGYEWVYRPLNPGLATDPYPASAPPPVVLEIWATLNGPKLSGSDRAKAPPPPAALGFTLDVREAG